VPAALCVALAGALAAGCGDTTQPATAWSTGNDRLFTWVPPAAATIVQTAHSALVNPTLAVVGDTARWRVLWEDAWPAAAPPPRPQVDFVLQSVIVVGLGRRGALGYTITIDSVVTRQVGATVHATESRLPASCVSADSGIVPVHMVRAPDHPPVDDWQIRTVTRPCGQQPGATGR
jgi:hypothetical protein